MDFTMTVKMAQDPTKLIPKLFMSNLSIHVYNFVLWDQISANKEKVHLSPCVYGFSTRRFETLVTTIETRVGCSFTMEAVNR